MKCKFTNFSLLRKIEYINATGKGMEQPRSGPPQRSEEVDRQGIAERRLDVGILPLLTKNILNLSIEKNPRMQYNLIPL